MIGFYTYSWRISLLSFVPSQSNLCVPAGTGPILWMNIHVELLLRSYKLVPWCFWKRYAGFVGGIPVYGLPYYKCWKCGSPSWGLMLRRSQGTLWMFRVSGCVRGVYSWKLNVVLSWRLLRLYIYQGEIPFSILFPKKLICRYRFVEFGSLFQMILWDILWCHRRIGVLSSVGCPGCHWCRTRRDWGRGLTPGALQTPLSLLMTPLRPPLQFGSCLLNMLVSSCWSGLWFHSVEVYVVIGCVKQKRSTEGCSKFKSPGTRQVKERVVSTLEHMQVPKWDRTRCPEE